jgi:hypothetical protein
MTRPDVRRKRVFSMRQSVYQTAGTRVLGGIVDGVRSRRAGATCAPFIRERVRCCAAPRVRASRTRRGTPLSIAIEAACRSELPRSLGVATRDTRLHAWMELRADDRALSSSQSSSRALV